MNNSGTQKIAEYTASRCHKYSSNSTCRLMQIRQNVQGWRVGGWNLVKAPCGISRSIRHYHHLVKLQ